MGKLDYQIERNRLVDEFNLLIAKYEKFTEQVSPRNWRTTGHHISTMKQYSKEMEQLQEITPAEKAQAEEWLK